MSSDRQSNWEDPMHAMDGDGQSVTVSFGREGTGREGETLLASGHREIDDKNSDDYFMKSRNHNHYGSGDGPNDNVKDNDAYQHGGKCYGM